MPRTFTPDEIYFGHLCDLSAGYAQRLTAALAIGAPADDRRIAERLAELTLMTNRAIEAGRRVRLSKEKIVAPVRVQERHAAVSAGERV